MNDPFDLENYKPQISMKDQESARRNSYQQTRVINETRARGVEPSIVYSPKGQDSEPKKFVIDMPHMPVLRPNRRTQMTDDEMLQEIARLHARIKDLEDTAMTSLQKRLAQPAQQEEPVAVHQFRKAYCSDWYDGRPDHTDGGGPYEERTLYTAPPRREWVELTDEQIQAVFSQKRGDTTEQHLIGCARALEAELRGKNT